MGFSITDIVRKIKLRYGSEETVNATLRAMGVRVGDGSRIYTLRFPSEPYLIRIGNKCLIAPDVTFVTHDANWVLQDRYDSLTGFGKIDIKDNSYIGVNATIMPNVTIGPNSVVGAGSVVTKDVPEGMVYAGNPAKQICTVEELDAKAMDGHIDVPRDRAELRKVLEKHFWGK